MNLLLCIYKSINNTCVFFLLLMELKNNAVYQVVGPSGSGKTHFVCKLLQNEKMFESKFNKIYQHKGANREDRKINKKIIYYYFIFSQCELVV